MAAVISSAEEAKGTSLHRGHTVTTFQNEDPGPSVRFQSIYPLSPLSTGTGSPRSFGAQKGGASLYAAELANLGPGHLRTCPGLDHVGAFLSPGKPFTPPDSVRFVPQSPQELGRKTAFGADHEGSLSLMML